MTDATWSDAPRSAVATLHGLYLVLIMTVLAAILTAAAFMQYGKGELPCPLCLLQRIAMFGVCFGVMQSFRSGYSSRNEGVSLLFTVFLLIVSVRQTLLDIYPRPGHSYIGSAVFGLHMPVWSILIAVALLIGYAVRLALFASEERLQDTRPAPAVETLARIVGLYVIALAAINFVSVALQCGVGECHTDGYAFLQKFLARQS